LFIKDLKILKKNKYKYNLQYYFKISAKNNAFKDKIKKFKLNNKNNFIKSLLLFSIFNKLINSISIL